MALAYSEQTTWSGRRLAALLGAVAVNLGFIAALSSGLDFRVDKIVIPPIVAEFIDPPAEQKPLVVPKPIVEPTPVSQIDVPEPIVPIELEPAPDAIVIPPEPQPQTPNNAPVSDTQLQADRRLTPPIYPAASRKLEEQGTVMLMIYVLPDGRVGDVRVAKSSGYPRLDQAAAIAARKGWTFRPATQGGSAVAAWGRYAVTFSLED